jgi:uncharacterized protein YndB with AHSA1/START domain
LPHYSTFIYIVMSKKSAKSSGKSKVKTKKAVPVRSHKKVAKKASKPAKKAPVKKTKKVAHAPKKAVKNHIVKKKAVKKITVRKKPVVVVKHKSKQSLKAKPVQKKIVKSRVMPKKKIVISKTKVKSKKPVKIIHKPAVKVKTAVKPIIKAVKHVKVAAKLPIKKTETPKKEGIKKTEQVAIIAPVVSPPLVKKATGKLSKKNANKIPQKILTDAEKSVLPSLQSLNKPRNIVVSEKPGAKEPAGRYELEYIVHSSAPILFEFLTSPSGLSEWFCYDVNIRNGIYSFVWDGSVQQAKVVALQEEKHIRFQWLDKPEGTYFEFRIEKDDLTGDISLIVVDFADSPDDIPSSRLLWNSQIDKLLHVLGSYF